MPLLQASGLSFCFHEGETLFSGISLSLTSRKVGLVGRNGSNKSIWASILNKAIQPIQSSVILNGSVETYDPMIPLRGG